MYSIDSWALQRGIKLDVNTNNISVTCTNSNEPGYLSQKLDYVGKTTAAINIKSITGSVFLNTAYGKYELLKKGLNIITYDFGFEQSDNWFSIRISEGSTVEIDFMKLEPGEHFTGMTAWNKTIELTKCMSRFQIIHVKAHNNNLNTNNRYYSCDTMFVVPMKKIHSVKIMKAYKVDGTNITSDLTGTEIVVGEKNVGPIVVPTARTDTMIKFDLELNADDY